MTEADIKVAVSDKLRNFREFYLDNVKLHVSKVTEISFDNADCSFSLDKNEESLLQPYDGGMFTVELKICIDKPDDTDFYIAEACYMAINIHFEITYGKDSIDIILPDKISVIRK